MLPLTRRILVPKYHGISRYFSTKSVSQRIIDLEDKYGAHNYHPIPVVIARGKGVHVWDVDGGQYLDFLSAYSAVNQGHCHPQIIEALKSQCDTLTLTSRAFHNDALGEYCEFMSSYFNYPRILPMNTGVEACYTTLKIARKWGYEVKGIPSNEGRLVFAKDNFWGRSFGAISSSTDPEAFSNFGPFMPNFDIVPFNDIAALKQLFESKGDRIAAFMCEPIQGEAGVKIPDPHYLQSVRSLCDQYNILWIADEVQTGLGRTGKRLCVDHDFEINDRNNNGPDLISLGKALSGGVFPVSAAVARTDEIMDVLTPGTHGSTYGGNPLACKVAMSALTVMKEEGMIENSEKMGWMLLKGLQQIERDFEMVRTVRGKGLFCAMEIEPKGDLDAWTVCMAMKDFGLLAKPTRRDTVRLSPPLVITESQIEQSLDIIRKALKTVSK